MPPSQRNARRLALLTAVGWALLGTDAAAQDVEAGGSLPVKIQTQPLWEVGIGGGALYEADYPAAGEYGPNGLALPYVIYRGDVFRVGGGSVARAVALETRRFEFDLSLSASFAADDNDARDGMPDLDFLFEAGPQVVYHAARFAYGPGETGEIDARLQARAVFSTDFSDLNNRGFLVEPEIAYRHRGLFGSDLGLNVALGSTFATQNLHDYFYSVAPADARPGRPAFDADAGYLGTEARAGLSIPIVERLRVFLVGKLGYYGGAANEDSPLFEDETNLGAGVAFVWRIFESEQRVARE